MLETKYVMVKPRRSATSLSAVQKAFSRLTLVLWPRMMTECFTISDFMAVIPLLPWCGLVLTTRSVLFNHREHVRVRYFQRAGGAGIFKPLLTSPCNALLRSAVGIL